MKTTKSSDSEEVTPSKKILKQARLPFKILSTEVSPKSVPLTRKRKLSETESEPLPKLGKITKQNSSTEELVVISDDDSQNSSHKQVETKTLNPLVKLVNTARKKKLQKTKAKKKKRNDKKPSENVTNSNSENDKNNSTVYSVDTDNESVKEMEVDVGSEAKCSNTSYNKEHTQLSENDKILPCNENGSSKNHNKESEPKSPKPEKDLNVNITSKDVTSSKRVTRSKLTQENSLNKSQLSTPDESDVSPSTPRKSNRSLSVTNSNEDVVLNESTTNLTPKQLQKKLESAKKRDEREKERLERDKKRQQEKEERAKQRLDKEEQRKKEREEKEEAKKKEREEKEEQKKKEKEEKEKQKELEKKLREEKEDLKRKEKEEKEEQKRKEKETREEERKKKLEALELEKQDQEQKKKKAAEAFVSFFVPKQKAEKDQATVCTVSKNDMLSSFTIKADMRLAPTTRVQLSESSKVKLETFLKNQNCENSSLYIISLKNGVKKSLSSSKTWPLSDKDDDNDVMIIEDELPPDGASEILTLDPAIRETLRPKLLAFHENRRPPYWGTWRKKSDSIKPKQPFKMDQKLLDYDVDSDDDWEEEQEGESIDGSAAGSDDEQDPDEYEVDNDVFVPHGYLSDEEATMDEDDVLSLSPESQKARLKHLEDEFESEMKKPMEKIKPRLYGLLWETANGGKPEKCADALWSYFGKLSMIMNDPSPFLQPPSDQEDTEKKKVKKKKIAVTEDDKKSPKSDKKNKTKSDKEGKKTKQEVKKNIVDTKKNQPGINTFLTKLKGS